jgi:hypothetical protein
MKAEQYLQSNGPIILTQVQDNSPAPNPSENAAEIVDIFSTGGWEKVSRVFPVQNFRMNDRPSREGIEVGNEDFHSKQATMLN